MEIMKRHYAIRINWLRNRIKNAPDAFVFKRKYKGSIKEKIKVRLSDGTSYTIDASTSDGIELLKQIIEKKTNKTTLATLEKEWAAKWSDPIPEWNEIFKCRRQRSPFLTPEAYEKAEAYQNSDYPLDKALMYNNRPYRTKGEVKLAMLLDLLGLEFKYEVKIIINGVACYPDFLVYERETGTVIIIEYGGMLEKREYFDKLAYRRQRYHNAGLHEGSDVVYINEYSDRQVEEEVIIANILSALEYNLVPEENMQSDRTYTRLSTI